ncbi:inner membrane complex protein 18 [Cystoisospora suis]|uniref:Inner membrane complex protein 18 n=1 Tax=Cystoisospora suis TaxID=483139 RepID=A0A2C6KK55_9APIC|nr:inner membrane complex protein 18 [Cystoisospora suis]
MDSTVPSPTTPPVLMKKLSLGGLPSSSGKEQPLPPGILLPSSSPAPMSGGVAGTEQEGDAELSGVRTPTADQITAAFNAHALQAAASSSSLFSQTTPGTSPNGIDLQSLQQGAELAEGGRADGDVSLSSSAAGGQQGEGEGRPSPPKEEHDEAVDKIPFSYMKQGSYTGKGQEYWRQHYEPAASSQSVSRQASATSALQNAFENGLSSRQANAGAAPVVASCGFTRLPPSAAAARRGTSASVFFQTRGRGEEEGGRGEGGEEEERRRRRHTFAVMQMNGREGGPGGFTGEGAFNGNRQWNAVTDQPVPEEEDEILNRPRDRSLVFSEERGGYVDVFDPEGAVQPVVELDRNAAVRRSIIDDIEDKRLKRKMSSLHMLLSQGSFSAVPGAAGVPRVAPGVPFQGIQTHIAETGYVR